MAKRIGVLTGGGDTSALNATLEGVALKAEELGLELIGFMKGWEGLLKGGAYFTLNPDLIDENQGGTILKSSRTNLIGENKLDEAVENLRKLDIDGLIAIGGDDTLSVGAALSEMFPTASVVKTIDNDVGLNPPPGDSVDYSQMVNYFCPGFPTAAFRIVEAVRDLRTTAYSHDRVFFVETMGRDAGWLALSSVCGHADLIVIPEVPYEPDRLAAVIEQKYAEKGNVIVVVSEGIRNRKGELLTRSQEEIDAFGHTRPGGCSEIIAAAMKRRLSPEIPESSFRHLILAYLQRCGSPIPLDHDCSVRAGQLSVEAIAAGMVNHVVTIMRTSEGLQPQLLPSEKVIKRDKRGKIIPRSVDLRFYDAENYQASRAGLGYFRPIFGDLPMPFFQPQLDIQRI
ncbi:MAG: 6-phosphofructokinase [Candidatus Poribacteria bacterium]|nr:6-phosphofructokinase [Candidatus Poribacteria bacterium]